MLRKRVDVTMKPGPGQAPGLMALTHGSPELTISLIDGPVVTQHPDLAGAHLRVIPERPAVHARRPRVRVPAWHLVAGIYLRSGNGGACDLSQLHRPRAPHLC